MGFCHIKKIQNKLVLLYKKLTGIKYKKLVMKKVENYIKWQLINRIKRKSYRTNKLKKTRWSLKLMQCLWKIFKIIFTKENTAKLQMENVIVIGTKSIKLHMSVYHREIIVHRSLRDCWLAFLKLCVYPNYNRDKYQGIIGWCEIFPSTCNCFS